MKSPARPWPAYGASLAPGSRRLRVWTVIASLLVAGCASPASPTVTFNPTAYLNQMVDVMQLNSINRKTIDWTSFRATVVAAGGQAASVQGVFPAISTALKLLGDRHSFYRSAAGVYVTNPLFPTTCNAATVPDPSVPATVGYVRVPTFGGSDGASIDTFEQTLQNTIRAADRADLDGWIIDLRGNGGGNFWAMLGGIGPILGEGLAGYFIDANDTLLSITYAGGRCAENGGTACVVSNPYATIQALPRVALLTDSVTVSAGELVLVSFLGRAGVRVFGTPTCGLPTGNRTFALSDRASLFLNATVSADRTGRRYDNSIAPDEVIADPAQVVERAIAWLRGQ